MHHLFYSHFQQQCVGRDFFLFFFFFGKRLFRLEWWVISVVDFPLNNLASTSKEDTITLILSCISDTAAAHRESLFCFLHGVWTIIASHTTCLCVFIIFAVLHAEVVDLLRQESMNQIQSRWDLEFQSMTAFINACAVCHVWIKIRICCFRDALEIHRHLLLLWFIIQQPNLDYSSSLLCVCSWRPWISFRQHRHHLNT